MSAEKDKVIFVRVDGEFHADATRAASARGLKLAEFARRVLLEELQRSNGTEVLPESA